MIHIPTRRLILRSAVFALLALAAAFAPNARAVTIPTVPVGNAGNAGEAGFQGPFGAVAYDYRIGTYEVTNAQYTEFLNAKAASDPLGLFDVNMDFGFGGISRSGSSGNYSYNVISGRGNQPVNWVTWYDAVRFANWLNNGQGSGSTETGAYTLGTLNPDGTPVNGAAITRNAGANWFLTSENEWYKAAYQKNDGVTDNYFDYPTSSDTAPTAEVPPGSGNSANINFTGIGLADVGSYTGSNSPYNTFDQAGNVAEWTDTLFGGSIRGLRGGDLFSGSIGTKSSSGGGGDPTTLRGWIGFRVGTVTAVPEPSTAVLAIVACGTIWWWRKRFK